MSEPMAGPESPHRIVVVTTGGTIAATGGDGPRTVDAEAPAVLAALAAAAPPGWDVQTIAARAVDSSQLSPADIDAIRGAVDAALADPAVGGVVVAHGTDTLEETALFLDLCHADPRPVVVTGAMRPADDPDADGPDNLRDAAHIAADPVARDVGVLVVMGRAVLRARGLTKWNTEDVPGFATQAPEDGGRPVPLRPAPRLADARVDIVAAWAGADATGYEAAVAAGARGIVIAALGSGNVPAALAAAIGRHPEVVTVISTRVPRGPVSAAYAGPGGGATLAELGAIGSGYLRPAQARVQLAALLASGADRGRIAADLAG